MVNDLKLNSELLATLHSVYCAHSYYEVMDSLPTDPIFKFPPNILETVRKQYNLDQPGRIEEAVDILCDWLEKQDHLVKKNYAREYLERLIINCKGSLERAKKKIDKLCTYRTLLPSYFEEFEIKDNPATKNICDVFLPHLTEDFNRVFLIKNCCKKIDFTLLEHYKFILLKCEYFQSRDYCNGVIVILDYSELNMIEYLKVLNLAEVEKTLSILTEGYATRIKAMHIITSSKLVDTLVIMVKKALSPKLAQRIHAHKDIESLYSFIPKDIMPIDYGGKEKSLQELNDQLIDEMTSEPFKNYIEDARKALTNESLRLSDGNVECMGVPGSFRKLTEGYATRIKAMHIITSSKLVDTLVIMVKKALSPKLAQRIHAHKDIESLYSFIPKDIMPIDYGGKEKSLQELNDQLIDEMTSEPFKNYIEDARKALTNESLRLSDGNVECMGVPGSFRKLTVD